jgi:hypothetical protein
MFLRFGSRDASTANRKPSRDGNRTTKFIRAGRAKEGRYNDRMFVLRYLYILALGVWLGGMAVAGLVAAPTIFSVLEAWNPVEGRVLAGQVFGAILAKLHLIFYGAAVVMLLTLTIRRLLGPKPVAYGIRASIIMLMFLMVLASGLGISPRVEAMQREIGGSVAALPTTDPRRASFYQLHGISNLLLSATAVGALLLVFWESREGGRAQA